MSIFPKMFLHDLFLGYETTNWLQACESQTNDVLTKICNTDCIVLLPLGCCIDRTCRVVSKKILYLFGTAPSDFASAWLTAGAPLCRESVFCIWRDSNSVLAGDSVRVCSQFAKRTVSCGAEITVRYRISATSVYAHITTNPASCYGAATT